MPIRNEPQRGLETVLMPYASIALPFGEVLCERTFYCDRYPHDCARLRIHCTAIQKRRDTGNISPARL